MKTPRRLFGRWLGINASIVLLAGGGMAQALDLPFCPLQAAISWSKAIGDNGKLLGCDRTQLSGNIYQYQAWVKVGQGVHDLIGINRVVKEQSPWVPVASAKAMMLLPGDGSSFSGNYLSKSTSAPADQALGVYLAQNNVDVWGMDYRWNFVSTLTSDFSFMKNWNTGTHLQDIKAAVNVARKTRSTSQGNNGKLFMLGFSRGAQFVYAYAEQQTQLPDSQRDLRGIIPMEYAYKFAPERQDLRQAAQARYQAYQAQYDSGKYVVDDGVKNKALALLAATLPDAPSLLVPGLSNKQAALAAVTATYNFFTPPLQPYTPAFHYLAGTFDTNELPSGLQFANYNAVLQKILTSPSYQSVGEMIDGEAIEADLPNAPYSANLSQITLPVLYVGAAGGYGDAGLYTLDLLGSSDKQNLMISLQAPEGVAVDYGHADLLWGANAKVLVWGPLMYWINTH